MRMTENKYRTKTIGEISEQDIDRTLTMSGWVENIRDHGLSQIHI